MPKQDLYEEQFHPAKDFKTYKGETDDYILCTTPRCGSHMLGHLLYECGCFGFPLEYIHPRNIERWKKRFKTDKLKSTIKKIKEVRTSEEGCFGIKVHWNHVERIGGPRALEEILPNAHFIILRRKNIIAQAVSYAKAKQDGVWIPKQEPKSEAKYNYKLIDECARKILKNTAEWRYQALGKDEQVMELCFEDVLQVGPKVAYRIGKFLNVSVSEDDVPDDFPTNPQKDVIKQEWKDRFRKEWDRARLFQTKCGSPGPLRRLRKWLSTD